MGEALETGHIRLHDSTLLNRTLISNVYITTFLKKIFASSPCFGQPESEIWGGAGIRRVVVWVQGICLFLTEKK